MTNDVINGAVAFLQLGVGIYLFRRGRSFVETDKQRDWQREEMCKVMDEVARLKAEVDFVKGFLAAQRGMDYPVDR